MTLPERAPGVCIAELVMRCYVGCYDFIGTAARRTPEGPAGAVAAASCIPMMDWFENERFRILVE